MHVGSIYVSIMLMCVCVVCVLCVMCVHALCGSTLCLCHVCVYVQCDLCMLCAHQSCNMCMCVVNFNLVSYDVSVMFSQSLLISLNISSLARNDVHVHSWAS